MPLLRMNPKKNTAAWRSTNRVKNFIHEKMNQGLDPEQDGDDIYEQIEEIDPEELLKDFNTDDDDDDLY